MTFNDEEEEKKQAPPDTSLEMDWYVFNPRWGDKEVSQSFQREMEKFKIARIKAGQEYVDPSDGEKKVAPEDLLIIKKRELWQHLSYLTSDVRNSNIGAQEQKAAEHYLNLAGDMLNDDFPEPSLICMERAAVILELSKAKGGFFMKNRQTRIKEETRTEITGKRPSILNRGGKEQ